MDHLLTPLDTKDGADLSFKPGKPGDAERPFQEKCDMMDQASED